MILLVFSSVVVILWVGAQDVLADRLTPGTLGQFVLYTVFAAGALGELSQVWGEISQAAGAAERLTELLAVEPVITAPAVPVPLPAPSRGEVAFEKVRFAYPARPETDVLGGVSFRIRAGEKVAIVGPSGAGKSTIFHLLLRYLRPDLRHRDASTACASPTPIRTSCGAHIALVPQDAVIFAASIADNIRFGRPDATDAEIARAAELAAASEFITPPAAGLRHARSASAASPCRAASASASPSPAPSCARRRCCCSTRRPPRSTPRARRWCRRRSPA